MKTLPLSPLVISIVIMAVDAFAQAPAPEPVLADNPPPALADADQAWHELQAITVPHQSPAGEESAPPTPLSREEALARYIANADKAKAFHETFPDHPKAGEARKLEIFSLLYAARTGDASPLPRLHAAQIDFRADKSNPEDDRFAVAAMVAQHGVFRRAREGEEMVLRTEYEKVARELLPEFPNHPGPYQMLIGSAWSSRPEHAASLAAEVLSSPAPAHIKAEALKLQRRLDLVGQAPDLAFDAGGETIFLRELRGKPVVIYAWATFSPGSLKFLETIKQLPAGRLELIGLNMDTDIAGAHAKATELGLPGRQVIDGEGLDSPLAGALVVKGLPEVYLIDKGGTIRDIHGARDLDAKIAQLLSE